MKLALDSGDLLGLVFTHSIFDSRAEWARGELSACALFYAKCPLPSLAPPLQLAWILAGWAGTGPLLLRLCFPSAEPEFGFGADLSRVGAPGMGLRFFSVFWVPAPVVLSAP